MRHVGGKLVNVSQRFLLTASDLGFLARNDFFKLHGRTLFCETGTWDTPFLTQAARLKIEEVWRDKIAEIDKKQVGIPGKNCFPLQHVYRTTLYDELVTYNPTFMIFCRKMMAKNITFSQCSHIQVESYTWATFVSIRSAMPSVDITGEMWLAVSGGTMTIMVIKTPFFVPPGINSWRSFIFVQITRTWRDSSDWLGLIRTSGWKRRHPARPRSDGVDQWKYR